MHGMLTCEVVVYEGMGLEITCGKHGWRDHDFGRDVLGFMFKGNHEQKV